MTTRDVETASLSRVQKAESARGCDAPSFHNTVAARDLATGHVDRDLVKLLCLAREGDECALERLLVEVYWPLKRFLLRRYTRMRDVDAFVDDAVQEALVRIADHIRECRARSHSGIIAWAITVARNVAADMRRTSAERIGALCVSVAPRHTAGADTSSAPSGPVDAASLPAAFAMWREAEAEQHWADDLLLRLVVEAQDSLPNDTVTIVWMRLIERASWDDVAASLGTTAAGAKRRFQRAQGAMARWVRTRVDELPSEERATVLARLDQFSHVPAEGTSAGSDAAA